ncbi:MAG: hypothetical protein AAGF60_03600 [Pseudomonadota bacterium]
MPEFKPKQSTKAEWQKARGSAAKGSGVGKSLEGWTKVLVQNFDTVTLTDLAVADKATDVLLKALDTADEKCKKAKDTDTPLVTKAYRKAAIDYKKHVKTKVLPNFKKRHEILKADIADCVSALSKKPVAPVIIDYAKNKAFFFEVVETYLLCKQGKTAQAVKKYHKDNDYNVDGDVNDILVRAHVNGEEVAPKTLKDAEKELSENVHRMIVDPKHTRGVKAYLPAYLKKNFPIAEFKL